MNCREAQSLLSARRDGPLEAGASAHLEAHLATCATCRGVEADLATGFAVWRARTAEVTVPDAQREWYAVRRRLRGADVSTSGRVNRGRGQVWFWRLLPLAAATAVALAVFLPRSALEDSAGGATTPAMARANSVEVPGGNASTMVFVDEKSGWLIVWASDTGGQSS